MIWLIPVVIFFDRLLKNFILQHTEPGGGFVIVENVFHITRVNNTGAAFGMWKGQGFWLTLISWVCVFILTGYLARGFFCSMGALKKTAVSLVLAGAASNLYDRLRYGYVIDYLDFRVWPVFNVADAAICTGAFLILFSFFSRES